MENHTMDDQAFEQMARDYERLLVFMDNIPDSIWFKDTHNRFVKVNKTRAEHSNTTPEMMIGKTDFEFCPERVAREYYKDDESVIKTGSPIKSKVEKSVEANGEETWVSTTKIPWYDKRGEIIGTIGVSRDITNIKTGEENRLFNMRLRDILYGYLITGWKSFRPPS